MKLNDISLSVSTILHSEYITSVDTICGQSVNS